MSPLAERSAPWAAWTITAAAVALAVIAWAGGFNWQFRHLTVYELFPVFGLLAFTTMWGQYVAGALAGLAGLPGAALDRYYRLTGYAVLGAIMLHPGLLIWQLWRSGLGLPPTSYLEHYVAPGLRLAAAVGSVCLLIFLAYELHRWFAGRSWWQVVTYLADGAMLGIFYHALRLGAQTQAGWFHAVWLFYGCTLIAALLYKYVVRYRERARHVQQ